MSDSATPHQQITCICGATFYDYGVFVLHRQDHCQERSREAAPEITEAMVERLAKHNWMGDGFRHGILGTIPQTPWGKITEENKEAERDIARAALTAVLETRKEEKC